MIKYIVLSAELQVTVWYPYDSYNDIVRYYNVNDLLHTHLAIQDHYTLTVF